MSGPPVQPRSRELEIVRVLFDKHLLERAVSLGEARWEGSGEMIRLAYHWRDLPPAERRERLEQIGPDQLAQFRSLAALDPDLARVLDALDERGVLDSAMAAATQQISGDDSPVAEEPEPVVENEPREATPEPSEPELPEDIEAAEPNVEPESETDRYAKIRAMYDVDPQDLGESARESLEDLVSPVEKRRAEAVDSGEEMLRRVRERLDSTARRATSTPMGGRRTAPTLPSMIGSGAALQPGTAATIVDAGASTFVPPPEYWINRLNDDRVVVVDDEMGSPTDDQLVAIANELGLGIAEFVAGPGTTRELFGGLRRSGRSVDVEVGPLPAALAEPCLAVIRGRFMPKIVKRLQLGMCDIPGTRTSVRVDPGTRVLVMPQV